MPGENRHQSSSNLKGHHMLDNYAIMEQQQQQQQHHQPAADLSEPVGNGSLQELYAQLVQKERDLLLAAQLGKALLEKNEELGLQNEKMAEEYSRQLEILEQEKHVLRRKVDNVEGEYESKVSELQSDVADLRRALDEQQNNVKMAERQKSSIITQLTEQNQRLTAQLKEAMKNEEQLSAQLQGLRDQFSLRKSSLQDHVGHLEIMREEIVMLTEKKTELERRLQHLLTEREGLTSNLDESSDRIVGLERQCHEQEVHLRETHRELNELRAANGSLCERLESMTRNLSSPSAPSFHHHSHSLLAEMDLSAASSGHGSASSPNSHPSLTGQDDIEIDDIECDDPQGENSLVVEEQNQKMRQEVMDACVALRSLCETVRAQRRRASLSLSSFTSSNGSGQNASVVSSASTDTDGDGHGSIPRLDGKQDTGLLNYLVKDIDHLVRGSAWFQLDFSQCDQCGRSPNDLLQLESELHLTQEAADRLQRNLADKTEESKRRNEEATSFKNQLTLKEVELEATREERDTARRDVRDTHLAKDEIIRRAWEVRDQAVSRKNAAEIELARTRIDVLQINSQLLEAIQQKVELSQQLDQWQVDMQQLLDDQMKSKLSKQERLRSMASAGGGAAQQSAGTTAGTANSPQQRKTKFLGLFQRS
ncbi:bicaudal D-related protein homolog [Daphnia pulex]|uniref:bicaudal D-related protein homolog n=1 Tax=Daphnia pulex TaxID=6669 RepID=UPI001EE0D3CD|nr:bicaudal D-related protein homolog [Daphnia pulex]